MAEPTKKCMVCGKPMTVLKGSICQPCQDRIRREAMGEQAGASERENSPAGLIWLAALQTSPVCAATADEPSGVAVIKIG